MKDKDVIIEKKSLPKKDKDSPQSVGDWMSEYISSPKYKERLSAFYRYPEYIQNKRKERVDSVTIENVPGDVLKYDPSSNKVKMSLTGTRNASAGREEILAHEFGHSVNSPDNPKGTTLSPREEVFIFDRARIDPDVRQSNKDSARRQALGLSEYLKISPSLHDYKPSETHSDINALRFLLKKRGIYDASTQDLTPEILQKAAKDPVIRKSFVYKRLLENYDEKALQEIMNTIALNQSRQSNLA